MIFGVHWPILHILISWQREAVGLYWEFIFLDTVWDAQACPKQHLRLHLSLCLLALLFSVDGKWAMHFLLIELYLSCMFFSLTNTCKNTVCAQHVIRILRNWCSCSLEVPSLNSLIWILNLITFSLLRWNQWRGSPPLEKQERSWRLLVKL